MFNRSHHPRMFSLPSGVITPESILLSQLPVVPHLMAIQPQMTNDTEMTAEAPMDLRVSSPTLPPTPESESTNSPPPPPLCLSQPSTSTATNDQTDQSITSDSQESTSSSSTKKKGKPTPDSLKDEAYYTRRAKNNASAKKSRDKHKQMELENAKRVEELTKRVAELEVENETLKTKYVTLLKIIDKVPMCHNINLSP